MTDPLKDHRLEDILAYHQGFLDDEQRRELEAHLRTCAACQKTSERAARFLPAVREAFTIPQFSSEELLANAKAQLRERQSASRPALWSRLRFALITFVAATAAGTALLLPRIMPAGQVVNSPRPPAVLQDAGPDAGAQLDAGVAPQEERR